MTPEEIQAEIAAIEAELERRQLAEQLTQIDAQSDQQIKEDLAPEQIQAEIEAIESILKERTQTEAPIDQDRNPVLANVGEFAAGFNRAAVDAADLVLSPVRATGEFITGQDVRSLREVLQPYGLEGGFVENTLQREIVGALGYTASLGLGLVPIQRAASFGSTTLDILGAGSTTAGQAVKIAQATEEALRTSDALLLGTDVLKTEEDIWEAAYNAGLRQLFQKARTVADEAEQVLAKNARIEKKNLERVAKGKEEKPLLDTIKIDTRVDHDQIVKEVTETYGVDPDLVRSAIYNKGLKYSDDPMAVLAEDRLLKAGHKNEARLSWYDRLVSPVGGVLGRQLAPDVGDKFENAFETAMRKGAVFTDSFGEGLQKVIKAVDDNPQLRNLFLDLHKIPENLDTIMSEVSALGKDAADDFRKLLVYSKTQNTEAKNLLYRGEGFTDDLFFHTEKLPKQSTMDRIKAGLSSYGRAFTEKPDELRDRTRPLTAKMKKEDLARYQNPVVSQLKHLVDQQTLLELTKEFGLRPSLALNDNVDKLFKQIERRLLQTGYSQQAADFGAELMRQAYLGSRAAPNPAIRAFMSLSYAGTLAQLKTAFLNLHDSFVASARLGARPTLKALMQTNQGVFGKNMQKLGVSDQAVGEYVRNFDKFAADPSVVEKIARVSKKIADGSMAISGFRWADSTGKGIVLRATVNKAIEAAMKNKLVDEFGDVLTKTELQRIRPHLKKGIPVKDMPKEAQELVEKLAFNSLGKQQLISAAGRPLFYLTSPSFRPVYALTGFAIKQQELLRKNVIDELRKGDYEKAGRFAAGYLVYAGFGYGLLNQTRWASLDDERDFTVEGLMTDAVDQVAAAITLNKLGDDYGRSQFMNNPVQFALESLLPPTGLTGAALKDASDMITKGEYNAELVKKFPLLGDIYKYVWSE